LNRKSSAGARAREVGRRAASPLAGGRREWAGELWIRTGLGKPGTGIESNGVATVIMAEGILCSQDVLAGGAYLQEWGWLGI
jgi:hypothetical protein